MAGVAQGAASSEAADPAAAVMADTRSLDGSGNNLSDPALGQAGEIYPRVASAYYADGVGELVCGRRVGVGQRPWERDSPR